MSNQVHLNLSEIKKGTELIFSTKDVFEEITQSTHHVSKEISDVFLASATVLTNAGETREIMDKVSYITYMFAQDIENILSTTEEQSATSYELTNVSLSLQTLVSELNDIVHCITATIRQV